MKNIDGNIKKIQWYIGLSYDFLFFLPIQVMFFTVVKGLDIAQVLFFIALSALFDILCQFVSIKIVKKIGEYKSIKISSIINLIALIIFLISPNFIILVVGAIFKSLGVSIQSLSQTPLFYDLLKTCGRQKEFSKLQGKGVSIYFAIDIVATVLAGMLFDINGYIPIIICIILNVILVIIVFKIKDVENKKAFDKPDNEQILSSIKSNKNKTFCGIRQTNNLKRILKSKTIILLVLFACIAGGLFGTIYSLHTTYFKELGLTATSIGVVISFTRICAFLASKYQYKWDEKFKSKNIWFTAIALFGSFIVVGMAYILKLNILALIVIGFVFQCLEALVKSPYKIYMQKYINKYCNRRARHFALAMYNICELFGKLLITFIAAVLIRRVDIGNTYVIIAAIVAVPFFVITELLYRNIKQKEKYEKQIGGSQFE
ncbi:MAG: hypothetical protein RSE00_05375 [Clostridia bacterium]